MSRNDELFARGADYMNLLMPASGFVQGLRALCDRHGAVLVCNEVMTGLRVHERGVQGITGIAPDLTTRRFTEEMSGAAAHTDADIAATVAAAERAFAKA